MSVSLFIQSFLRLSDLLRTSRTRSTKPGLDPDPALGLGVAKSLSRGLSLALGGVISLGNWGRACRGVLFLANIVMLNCLAELYSSSSPYDWPARLSCVTAAGQLSSFPGC